MTMITVTPARRRRILVTLGALSAVGPLSLDLYLPVLPELAADLGIELDGDSTGGMSDANLTSALGVPTIDGLGAVGGGGHSENEHVLVSYMPERIALLVRIFSEIGSVDEGS